MSSKVKTIKRKRDATNHFGSKKCDATNPGSKIRKKADSHKGPVSCGNVSRPTSKKFDPKTMGINNTKKEGEPYPKYTRPTTGDCYRAQSELITLHGDYSPGESGTVLDSLVRTILSQNTTDITSARAFRQLKQEFPTWEEVENASEEAIAVQIKCCGLADKRAAAIKGILTTLRQERDDLSMEYVHEMDDERVKKELTRFKGVGPKTAACVLMFCLKRAEFPVDTHVWRITKALGWVPQAASREKAYEHLNRRIPDDVKFSLHCLLVEHGKCCKRCAKNGKPRRTVIGPCPLSFTKISMESAFSNKSSSSSSGSSSSRVKMDTKTKVKTKKK
tara:strand:+ start:50 stop:1048 length:999 start_codon:yes stop_codon:yes gene_type:complete